MTEYARCIPSWTRKKLSLSEVFKATSEDLANYKVYLENFWQLLCSEAFHQVQVFNKIPSF